MNVEITFVSISTSLQEGKYILHMPKIASEPTTSVDAPTDI